MQASIFVYAPGVWIGLVIAAILNASIRNLLVTPRWGEQTGHVAGTVSFIGVIFLVTYLFLSNLESGYTQSDLLLVGLMWLALTIAFEFVFGRFVMGHPWRKLLADYNILRGRVWVLVLAATFTAPIIMGSALR
jgi:hypothetical protein